MEDIQGWNDSKFEYYFSGTSDEIPLSKEEMLELLCEKYSKDWYAKELEKCRLSYLEDLLKIVFYDPWEDIKKNIVVTYYPNSFFSDTITVLIYHDRMRYAIADSISSDEEINIDDYKNEILNAISNLHNNN